MVPPLQPTDYLFELRALAENISRERGQHSEVHPPEVPHYEVPRYEDAVPECEELVTNAPNADNVSNVTIPENVGNVTVEEVREVVDPQLGPESRHNAEGVADEDASMNVGPAWVIPMTQEKSLAELPSQLDVDWQDQVPLTPAPAPAATRNLGQELEAAASSEVVDPNVVVAVNSFAEVQQLAQEAVMNATQ